MKIYKIMKSNTLYNCIAQKFKKECIINCLVYFIELYVYISALWKLDLSEISIHKFNT